MSSKAAELNHISGEVVDSAMRVHSALGPGLLESAYEPCLCYELQSRGLAIQTQVALPVVYRNIRLNAAYRIDLLVEERIIVELKAVEKLLPLHEAQLLSYLKLSGHRLGLLLNFHTAHLRDGIRRLINGEL